MVSVGIFSWALLEPSEGVYDFARLDRILDLLHENGIAADLATPTAAPPAWFFVAHPDALPVDKDGRRLSYGSRQTFCPSQPRLPRGGPADRRALGERYADHPAVVMWHVHNEYGCHNARVLLRHERGGLPGLAARDVRRRPGGAQPRLGHHVLEPVVLRLGRDPAAPRRPARSRTPPTSWTGAASAATSCCRCARRSARCCGGGPRHPGHHQLHGDAQLRRRSTTGAGRRSWTSSPTTTTSCPTDPESEIDIALSGDLVRSLAGGPVAADGALHRRGQLAAGQPGQAAGRAAPQRARPRGPRRRRHRVLPVAGREGGRRAVALGDAPARRHGQPDLA